MRYEHTGFSARQAYGRSPADRIAQFLPMVRKLAWYYESTAGPTVDLDDLMQAGLIALSECAQRHDRPDDDGFAAYAKIRVRGAMVDLLRSQSHRSRGAAKLQRRIDAAIDTLKRQHGRDPTSSEIAGTIGISLADLDAMRVDLSPQIGSLDEHYSDQSVAFMDDSPDAEKCLLQSEDAAELARAIAALPERLQLVIQLHFVEELNLTEIAAVMDISVPRVHQLKAAALEKLRLHIVARE